MKCDIYIQQNITQLIHPVEFYLALIKKEILSQTTIWMNCEDTNLSEISQSQKEKYYVLLLTWDTESTQSILLKQCDFQE